MNLKEQAYLNKKKSLFVAYILLILLGGFGLHRFYLQRYLTALIILFCTVGSFFIEPLFIISFIFIFFDLFLIPKMVRTINTDIQLALGLE